METSLPKPPVSKKSDKKRWRGEEVVCCSSKTQPVSVSKNGPLSCTY